MLKRKKGVYADHALLYNVLFSHNYHVAEAAVLLPGDESSEVKPYSQKRSLMCSCENISPSRQHHFIHHFDRPPTPPYSTADQTSVTSFM